MQQDDELITPYIKMAMLQRIGTVAEIYRLEMTIHMAKFLSESETVLKIRLKRGRNKKETTKTVKGSPGVENIPVTCHLQTKVTLYLKGSKHLAKWAQLQLLILSKGKFIEKGCAKLDLASLVHSPLNFQNISLGKSSDHNASLCISAFMKNNALTSSMATNASDVMKEIISYKMENTNKIEKTVSNRAFPLSSLNKPLWKSVIIPHRIICEDHELSYSSFCDGDEPITIDSILQSRNKTTVYLPPTAIRQVKPNVQSKASL